MILPQQRRQPWLLDPPPRQWQPWFVGLCVGLGFGVLRLLVTGDTGAPLAAHWLALPLAISTDQPAIWSA
jgi:hypothetical protein